MQTYLLNEMSFVPYLFFLPRSEMKTGFYGISKLPQTKRGQHKVCTHISLGLCFIKCQACNCIHTNRLLFLTYSPILIMIYPFLSPWPGSKFCSHFCLIWMLINMFSSQKIFISSKFLFLLYLIDFFQIKLLQLKVENQRYFMSLYIALQFIC